MTAADESRDIKTLRSTTGVVSFVIAVAVGLFLLADVVVRAGWSGLWVYAPPVLLALWVIYEVSFVSMIRFSSDGVEVRNLLRRTTFGWAQVRDIDMRWQLVFSLADGKDIACFGGPARSRPPRRPTRDEGETAAKAPTGYAELAEITERWHRVAPVSTAPIRRSLDIPALIVLAALVVWQIAALNR